MGLDVSTSATTAVTATWRGRSVRRGHCSAWLGMHRMRIRMRSRCGGGRHRMQVVRCQLSAARGRAPPALSHFSAAAAARASIVMENMQRPKRARGPQIAYMPTGNVHALTHDSGITNLTIAVVINSQSHALRCRWNLDLTVNRRLSRYTYIVFTNRTKSRLTGWRADGGPWSTPTPPPRVQLQLRSSLARFRASMHTTRARGTTN